MTPGPKKRGQQNKSSNDIRGDDKQDKVRIFQGKGQMKNVRRDKQQEDIRKNTGEENQVQSTEISSEINLFRNKYSKRALNTNWDKYEEITEKSNESAGMDFQVALNCSSSAASQLRLEEEKGWDEEFLKIDSNDFTSINCDNLMKSLECIPFHDRLGISKDFFTDSMVNEFINDAEFQRKVYISPKTSRDLSKQTELKNTPNLQKENDVKNIIESLTNCLILKDGVIDEEKKNIDEEKKNIDLASGDDTLEMLLSLSEEKFSNVSEKLTLPSHSEISNVQNKFEEKVLENCETSLDEWLDSVVES